MNSIVKWIALLLLGCCTQSWGAKPTVPPGGGPPNLTECNATLLFSPQPMEFGTFIGASAGTVTIDPNPLNAAATYIGVTSVGPPGMPGIIRVDSNTTVDCSRYKVIVTVTHPASLTGPGGMTVSNGTTYFEDASGTVVDPALIAANGFAGFGTTKSPLYIRIGATLTVQGTEPSGSYSGPYTVDVIFSL